MLRLLLEALPPAHFVLEQAADHEDLGQAHRHHDEQLEGGEGVYAGEVGLHDVAVPRLVHLDEVLQLDGLVQVLLGAVDDALKQRESREDQQRGIGFAL